MCQISCRSSFVAWGSRLRRTMLACLLPTLLPIAFGQTSFTTAQIAKSVSPSVVVIQGKTDSGDVLGSGFIISKDGKIATNLHVIRDMKTASVQLANGELFHSVSVLATDERRDLAVLKIAGSNLPVLELGDSDALTVGEPLVIVGSPRGLEGTVTAGILSSIRDSGDGFKVLQTDAAVNPGNSGGPLANNKGQAIGVVSFKLRSSEGLNFAIPINYERILLNSVHSPITLEQMRRSLTAASTSDQHTAINLAGVELHLGMSEESVLSKFKPESRFKVSELGPGWYLITVKMDSWLSAGNLTFHDGKLTRIALDAYSSEKNDAASFVKAVYSAIAEGEKVGIVSIWTGRNDDTSSPMDEVHILFKDREVVFDTLDVGNIDVSLGNIESSSLTIYFPRMLRSAALK
jgi:S1-C subfamily serine protease